MCAGRRSGYSASGIPKDIDVTAFQVLSGIHQLCIEASAGHSTFNFSFSLDIQDQDGKIRKRECLKRKSHK